MRGAGQPSYVRKRGSATLHWYQHVSSPHGLVEWPIEEAQRLDVYIV